MEVTICPQHQRDGQPCLIYQHVVSLVLQVLSSADGLLGFDAEVAKGTGLEQESLPFLGMRLTFNTCSPQLYAALLIVDTEEEFTRAEISKLHRDVGETGLSLVVAAEWYDHQALRSLRFKDENKRRWWRPVTGGCNLPALNDLLAPYGVEFAAGAASGTTR